MSDELPVTDDDSLVDANLVDADEVRRAMEYYLLRGWTDGLPVVPVTASYLDEFLATTSRDPDEVLLPMPHLNKALTVRLAAINAALAGCLPEYLPVVLAAWDAFLADGMVPRAIWQSTTGTAPFSVLFGPLRTTLGFPGYQYVTVPHPIASRTQEEIDEIAAATLPEIVRVLGAGLTIRPSTAAPGNGA